MTGFQCEIEITSNTLPDAQINKSTTASAKSKRWKRLLKRIAIVSILILLLGAFVVRNHVRTLWSLQKIRGTNAYVMDYYCDYNLEEIRVDGVDPQRIEDSCIETFFPDAIVPIVTRIKTAYVPSEINSRNDNRHHCSTVSLKSSDGKVFFGRNFDWPHDACLILRIHDGQGIKSLAIIDLHYLNLNRGDLEQTSIIERLPLLFAPYYVMDGINRHGVAVSEMSVEIATPPRDEQKPDITSATLMRIMLDYAQSTEEAVQLIDEYNVYFEPKIHFMIADSSGDSRVVEFVNGEIKVTRSTDPWQISANSVVYGKSEQEMDSECARYRSGSNRAETLPAKVDFDGAISVARSMAVENYTMWTSVYNLQSGELRFFYKSRHELEHRDGIN